ncbi:putative transcriptional regulator [Haloferax elongans ATCC BAA-1513]|uniref:Putative transcriptional regulator n=1 Tax=Haloferax elongans ATCC BAA-1513 TaxID=1230453 RepID=M0HD17_HALEO|nr:helix-turn-helix domain-containing protein [Haloferax elongans]ELZ80964.1 putative transcriptional regulator [Haloferax elongans ATCC BAA-1513]
MSTEHPQEDAIDVLQQLGLKEYEAKCFVGLARVSTGTAKQLSEITDVPRTRIYDAIRVLEAQGLVEIQHTSPQQFRAVPLAEATETLRSQYENRIERLTNALEQAEKIESDDKGSVQEVWAMSGKKAIENRTFNLLDDADSEIVLVLGDDSLLTDKLVARLNARTDDVDVLIGAATSPLQTKIRELIPDATTFVSGLEWLRDESAPSDSLAIGRLLLVDRSTILVSTLIPESGEENAIFGGGFQNGLIVISRRLLSQGLLASKDPN